MSDFSVAKMREHARELFDASILAVDAGQCVRRFVSLDGALLNIGDQDYDLSQYDRVLVVGMGKASSQMAVALEDILGDHIGGGLINTKYEHREALKYVEVVECGHPVPDEAGVVGTQRILDLLADADDKTLVICVISGGGSALTPAPVGGVNLADKQETTRLLLACGANIVELNAIRKHLSRIKGGGMARIAFPATVVALMLSDVIGDPMDVIASGPTVPDTATFQTCMDILDKYDLVSDIPEAVRTRFEAGVRGEIDDTPKPGDAALSKVQNLVVGSNGLAVEAAAKKAKELGYNTLVLSTRVEGEAREVAYVYAGIAKEIVQSGQPIEAPACVISGGETTVLVRGDGKGGRNQELTLSAAIQLAGWDRVVMLSGGTDGTDGPTDAAGAIADGETIARATKENVSALAHLKNNDAYHFFKPLDDLIMTGATGTNVAD
ncbi:MAG: glycerate kinase, partial [Candidatus Latescibacteria bacterium]|nr:glycerate kinase [Candidatus Latescibacterota bacterium]